MRAASEGPVSFTVEFRFMRADEPAEAPPRWMSMVGRFVLNEEGHPIHSVGVATDVTASRLAADELRKLKESAERANRAKDHFLAVLSHELRTPLTPVLATVQDMLRDRGIPSEMAERLDIIHRNVELEARLIDDLLDLTRISRGKMELQRSDVDVHQILEHALRTCDEDFRSKNISVHVSLKATRTHVMGDRGRLLQIFWNVLKNAAKFTPSGQSVEVHTNDAPDHLIRIDVRDTGIGIEPATLNSIFNAFEQGSITTTRKYGGLGLGLSISKTLVELHGGAITAMSDGIGQGACFTLEFPAETASKSPHRAPEAGASMVEHLNADRPMSSRRLLLIEDHPDTCQVMQRLLRSAGYEVTAAETLAAALRACKDTPKPFDIVVSDLGLPDGSGLDFIRQFRISCPDTPAIALSGFGMEDDRLRSLDAGFVAHMTKPVDLSALQSKIEEVISQASASKRPSWATSVSR
jgi:hypothetical protein